MPFNDVNSINPNHYHCPGSGRIYQNDERGLPQTNTLPSQNETKQNAESQKKMRANANDNDDYGDIA